MHFVLMNEVGEYLFTNNLTVDHKLTLQNKLQLYWNKQKQNT